MIGRSALLSDSLPWTSDKTGRNACGPVAIRVAPVLVNMRDIEALKEDDGFEGAFLSP